MIESGYISDSQRWQAVVSCDKNYDGLFLYGVKTTRIFCRPSCNAKTPSRINVIFFTDAAQAMEEGFRPCKKCCPDKEVFEPALELVKKVRKNLDSNYHEPTDLNYISKQLGVSTSHMVRLFKQQNGLTPAQYITKARIYKAAELLVQTDLSILEITNATGFESISNFYKHFKQYTMHTPNEYRKSRGEL